MFTTDISAPLLGLVASSNEFLSLLNNLKNGYTQDSLRRMSRLAGRFQGAQAE